MSDHQDKAFAVMGNRGIWEQKQRLYYMMRHDGLRRLNKPFPTAADAHFPLIDMEVANLKPFWMAQAFSGERMADFVCMKEQLKDFTEAAADFLDFELRYRTDFRYQMERAVDTMLLRGRGVLKCVYDPFKERIAFRSIDPLYILMAEQYDDFEDADFYVEIQTLTVDQYKRNRNFDQTALPFITGKTDWNMAAAKLDKQVREGITHSGRDDGIVLWNYYERMPSAWVHHTHCPLDWARHIRNPYSIPYEWDGQPLSPHYSITMEIKDEGFYAPRGVAELNAAFEAYCCKLWNDKSDSMTFANRPLFTTDKEIQNPGNLRFMPGELIPGNIKAVPMPPPAMSFSEEINFTREVAEQRAKMPDYGIQGGSTDGKPRTATENNRIASLQDVGADHNGEMFRSVRLSKIFRHAWMLVCRREDLADAKGRTGRLAYYVADNLKTLPAQALHDQYLVLPAGTAGTKQQRLQRAVGRFQLFKGMPNVDQDGLVRDVIAADDSRLVAKLLIPGSLKAGTEAEDEAVEIGIMLIGFPAQVRPGEDNVTRIMVLVGFLQKQELSGATVDPIALQRIQGHLMAHLQVLQQSQPDAVKGVMQQIAEMEQQTMQAKMQMQAGAAPGQGAPGGALPPLGSAPPSPGPGGPGGPGQGPPGAPGQGLPGKATGARESIAINYKDAPEDIKRQMEAAAGFTPSKIVMPPAPAPAAPATQPL